jgi:hypothetical protein
MNKLLRMACVVARIDRNRAPDTKIIVRDALLYIALGIVGVAVLSYVLTLVVSLPLAVALATFLVVIGFVLDHFVVSK